MDNAKNNKCWTVFAGLCALVSAGIVLKVKVSFCLASHGHIDIDATIAKIIAKPRKPQ